MGSIISGIFGGSDAPAPPAVPMPPPAAHPATYGSAAVQGTLDTASKAAKAAGAMGSDGTVKTSPQGLKPPQTAKTLLG